MPDEFDCPDCGIHVIRFVDAPNLPHVCAGCGWLRDTALDSLERARLRGMMAAHEVIGSGNGGSHE